MIPVSNVPIDTALTQRRRGYADLRRTRQVRVGGGDTRFQVTPGETKLSTLRRTIIETDPNAESGFYMRMNGPANAYEFVGEENGLIHARLVTTTEPFTGSSGASLEHGSGLVRFEVSGDGEGLGSQQVVLTNEDASVYFSLQRLLDGTTYIVAHGLPTANPGGDGILWNDGGTLKIT